MRESGFDVTFRFGPFGAETHHYAPVCLNSLLYKTEKDLEQWPSCWDVPTKPSSGGKSHRTPTTISRATCGMPSAACSSTTISTKARSTYEYATTFYPLWAGLASAEQAPGGPTTSALRAARRPCHEPSRTATRSGIILTAGPRFSFWPSRAAPLRQREDADRIAAEFLHVVINIFNRPHDPRKIRRGQRHRPHPYRRRIRQNFVGFGWTNAGFLELWSELPRIASRAAGAPHRTGEAEGNVKDHAGEDRRRFRAQGRAGAVKRPAGN